MRFLSKKVIIPFLAIAMLLIPIGIAMAFPGFGGPFPWGGPCNDCHNEPGAAYYGGYAAEPLVLDGYFNESFWTSTSHRRMEIPVGTGYGDNETFVKMIFAQTSTDLYITIMWNDPTINGTDTAMYDDADGIAICWNINVPDFEINYAGPMVTDNSGELVDTFVWKPPANETGLQTGPSVGVEPRKNQTVNATSVDYVMTNTGWLNDTTGVFSTDYSMVAKHGNITDHHTEDYALEISRPLVTGDSNDVQFNHAGNYEFAIVIFNATSGADHMVSFVHEVYIYVPSSNPPTPPIPGFEFLFIIIAIAALVAAGLGIKKWKFSS